VIGADGRPIIAEKTITKTILPILMHGGGTPADRGFVAAGLIIAKVCDAYGVTPEELEAA
jgi:hypothetical protein